MKTKLTNYGLWFPKGLTTKIQGKNWICIAFEERPCATNIRNSRQTKLLICTLINSKLKPNVLPIRENVSNFEKMFQIIVFKAKKKKKIKQVKGRKRKETIDQSLRFHAFENEILSRDELKFEEEKNHKIRLAELYKDLSTAQAKLNSTIEKCEQHENLLFEFQNANESLNKYIETLKGPFQNRGKEIGDLNADQEQPKNLTYLNRG